VTVPTVAALEQAGFTTVEARRRQALFQAVADRWPAEFPEGPPTIAYHVPGRIEVLGKHTDYAGGRSLVCATEQGMAMLARIRPDPHITVVDANTGERRSAAITSALQPERGDWSNYPMTVARRFATDFAIGHGIDVAFASDIPYAAGVSSSSALVVGIALLLIDANHLRDDPRYRAAIGSLEDLGAYLGAVENGRPFRDLAGSGGVGTLGGSQDQTAILCSRPNALARYRFDPVTCEGVVPWPERYRFAVASSGVVAEKAGAAIEHYNDLARLTNRLAEVARAVYGGGVHTLGAALLDHPDAPTRIAEAVASHRDSRLVARLTQLVAECRLIIPGVVAAFERGDLRRVGELVELSQEGAELGLGNQIPETTALVSLARERGAVAASAFGAGFGGSVWAMVAADESEVFADRWLGCYLQRFPQHRSRARVLLTRPAPAAVRVLSDSPARSG
jgi:galactokinase